MGKKSSVHNFCMQVINDAKKKINARYFRYETASNCPGMNDLIMHYNFEGVDQEMVWVTFNCFDFF
jgi:hypothetical protein